MQFDVSYSTNSFYPDCIGLNGNGSRVGGFAMGEYYYELLSKSNELSMRQKLARVNDTEGMIQKLVVNEAGTIDIISFRDMDECIRDELQNMNANALRKGKSESCH